ncbi:hypothetical protein V865_001350 [Kwoniella europaea PYCC6329]|uniref:Uncharacterized protein n=1 Tax=Kwoniella europaea PYCC6329 TaxID=1423913 RepID=A0AAX4KBI8_9TREE
MERRESSGTQHQGNGSTADTGNDDNQTAFARDITPSQLEQGQGSTAAGTTADTKHTGCRQVLRSMANAVKSLGPRQETEAEREDRWARMRDARVDRAEEEGYDAD